MPRIKSAQKQMRVSERRRTRNKSVRSMVKTNITRAERLIFTGEREGAGEAVVAAVSSLDRAAEKGILHPKNAARRKSRLVKKLNAVQVAPPAETEPAAESETESEDKSETE